MGSNPSTSRQRLDSWKEIAVFFGRDERTVNRWEKELGLPVHRLPGTKGRVYAYTDELSDWLAAPRTGGAGLSGATGASLKVLPERTSPAILVPDSSTRLEAVPAPSTVLHAGPRHGGPAKTGWLVAGALLIVATLALMLYHPTASLTSATDTGSAATGSQQASPRGVVQASSPVHSPEAEQLYLKGRYYWNKRTPEDLNKAVDYFTQAIVHDPSYAAAYVGLADCYNLLREYTLMPSGEAYTRALAAAKRAVELDDQSSAAHASLAFTLFFGTWDLKAGEREFQRAIALDPNNASAHHWYANCLLALHRFPESLAEIERAQALDPTSTSILADKGNILLTTGRKDEALVLLQQMEKTEPGFRSPHLYLQYFYLRNKDYPHFLAELKLDAQLMHDNSGLAIETAAEKGFAASGSRGMFEGMLRAQKKFYAQGMVPPTTLAQTCAWLGNNDGALRYLKAAYEQRDGSMLFVNNDPEFEGLRDEPTYRDLLTRIGVPIEN